MLKKDGEVFKWSKQISENAVNDDNFLNCITIQE